MYEHILSAIPHIRPHPSFSPDPLTPSSSRSQPFDTLVQLAADGLQFLSGRTSRSDSALSEDGRPVSPRPVQTKRASGTMHGEKAKVMTKCLGCGATATPEWRRGPMGPRTLCNACVSVASLASFLYALISVDPSIAIDEPPANSMEGVLTARRVWFT